MNFLMECSPALNYARDGHETEVSEKGAYFRSAQLDLGLATQVPLKQRDNGVFAEFALREEQSAVFVLRQIDSGATCSVAFSRSEEAELFMQTVGYWRHWLSKCTYTGRWREMVHRSALVLKLLTYEPTVAIVAAPTTSLREGIGGERNDRPGRLVSEKLQHQGR